MYGLAGAGAAATLGALVSLHPYQHLYFNFLVDRATPERLLARYDLDYWHISFRRALEFLLARYLDGPIRISHHSLDGHGYVNHNLLPAADRQRLKLAGRAGDFYIAKRHAPRFDSSVQPTPYAPVVYAQQVYGNPIVEVLAVDLAQVDGDTAASYRASHRALAAREPVIRDRFDVYLDERAVSWVRASCRPEDTASRFRLHVSRSPRRTCPRRSRASGSTT